MNAKLIVEQLQNRKGQHVSVTWRREMKTLKTCQDSIEKQTTAHVRAGINYANLASVKEGIATGERGEVQPLPTWQEWELFPFILKHKTKGTEYVRLYPAAFDNLIPSVSYFRNGQPVDKESLRSECYASEFAESEERTPVFCIKAESVLNIGN